MKMKLVPTFCKAFATVSIGAIALASLVSPARAAIIYVESINAIGGDLSNVRLNPISPTDPPGPNFIGELMDGSNFLTFVLNNPEDSTGTNRILRDLDYFYVTVPQGFILSQLLLNEYDPTIGGTVTPGTDQIAFIALQPGTEFTEPAQPSECPTLGTTNCNPVPTVTTNTNNLLGYTLIGTESAANMFAGINKPGEDILPFMGATMRPPQPNGSVSPIPNNGLGFIPPLAAGNYVFWAQQTAPGKVTVRLNFVVSRVPEPTSVLGLLGFGALGLGLSKKKF